MKYHLTLLFLLLSACAQLTLQRPVEPSVATGETREVKLYTYFWGLLPGPPIRTTDLCPSSHIETVDLKMGTGDVLLSTVTLGIYIPHHARVACAQQ